MKSKGMQILTQAEFDALEASDLLVDGRQYYVIDGVPRGLVSRADFDAEMANKVDKTSNLLKGDGLGRAIDSGISVQELQNEIDGKQDALTFDDTPTIGSNNPVKSGGIYTAIENKVLGDVADNSIPLSKLKSVSVDTSLSPRFFDFVDKTWSGFTSLIGQYIWTDGTNIYCCRLSKYLDRKNQSVHSKSYHSKY